MQENNAGDARTQLENAPEEGFRLGKPAIVCRWRLASSTLPMANRHLRGLSARRLNGGPVSPHLIAWAKQHIEWTLADGVRRNPDGVLMLVVDESGQAAMSCGPFVPLSSTTVAALASRAADARREAAETGVAPESLWLVRDGALVEGVDADARGTGVATLVADLAKTLGMAVSREDELAERVAAGAVAFDEAFLVSDEFGIVPASDASGPESARLREGYERLMERSGKMRRA